MILLQSGDPEISGALAGGILAARARRAGALPSEQIEVVEAEIDRQRIQTALLRVAVGNHKSAEDYAALVTKARGDYGQTRRPPGTARKVGKKLLGLYGLLCYTLAQIYKSQEKVLQ